METVTTKHPLRTIILQFNRSRTPLDFEAPLLDCYTELHDRAYAIQQRIREARKKIPDFVWQIEGIEECQKEAERKFKHLTVMLDTNPCRDRVREQLTDLLTEMEQHVGLLVDPLIKEANAFFEFDDYIFEQEKWMNEVAFKQFYLVSKHYQACSIHLSHFDVDLEDFKYKFSDVKLQEKQYTEDMNALIDRYSDLNYNMDQLFINIENFDETLLP